MSINSRFLKNSMNECYEGFIAYYNLIHQQLHTVLDFWQDYENEALYKKIKDLEDESNFTYRKNVASIEWYVCQQTPIANNLRFFLSILISLKDLERCGDYAYSIAKILYKNKLNKQAAHIFDGHKVWSKLCEKSNQMWAIFTSDPKKISDENFALIKAIKKSFFEDFKATFEVVNENVYKSIKKHDLTAKDSSLTYVYLVAVKIDRTLDHIFNIIENFYFKDRPFFFDETET